MLPLKIKSSFVFRTVAGSLCLLLASCSTAKPGNQTRTVELANETANDLLRDPVPGTVNDIWVEPMIDTVRVPGAIDPNNIYYRKQHTAVVEIRKGRGQFVEYPDSAPVDAAQSQGAELK